MKVLLINGSLNAKGCTYTALSNVTNMKKIFISLLCVCNVFFTLCAGELSNEQQNASTQKNPFIPHGQLLREKDTVWVSLVDTKPILGYHHEIISPNTRYGKKLVPSGYYRKRYVSGDTIRIYYFDSSTHNLTQKEQYLCSVCDVYDGKISDERLQMDGIQSYYNHGRLVCEDLYRKGNLKASTWFDASGNIEKKYVYSGNFLVMQMQMYPSGAIKYRETYISATQIQKQGFIETGEEGVWEDPSFPGGVEAFQAYFNQHFHSALYNNNLYRTPSSDELQTVVVSIDSLGHSQMWLNSRNRMAFDVWEDPECPLWNPAKINGNNVSSTIAVQIMYNPMQYVKDGDTVNITVSSVAETQYRGKKWIHTISWMITPATESDNYAVCHYINDTLELVGYRSEDHSLFMRQQYMPNKENKYVNTGYAYKYKDNNANPYYGEFYTDSILQQIVWYYENGNPKYRITPNGNLQQIVWYYENGNLNFKSPNDNKAMMLLEEYYPTGEIKVRETCDIKKDNVRAEYFNRIGKSPKVILPTYPGGIKVLGKMVNDKLAVNEDLKKSLSKLYSNLETITLSGKVDLFVEVDEHGRLIESNVGKMTCVVSASQKVNQYLIISDTLSPFLKEVLQKDTTVWIPGKIDGNPELLRTKIQMNFNFTVKLK